MHYDGDIIRPPSEADSIILQVTSGCSYNKCTFCGAYKGKSFRIKPDEMILDDLSFAARYCRNLRRVFVCDGDPLIIPAQKLLFILGEIRKKLPWVNRIGAYANAKSIGMRSMEELRAFKQHGLGIIYMGLESGDDQTLRRVCKAGDVSFLVEQGRRIRESGIKLSISIILGLAGPERSYLHAVGTGKAITSINADHVAALSLIPVPGTILYEEWKAGRFELLDAMGMLAELRTLLENTELSRGIFLSNHASNYLPMRLRLPRDKSYGLGLLEKALSGRISLKPEFMRGL